MAGPTGPVPTLTPPAAGVEELRALLERALDDRERAECLAHIQREAVQLALDLLVSETDVSGFFRAFISRLVEETGSHACGVWLLGEAGSVCDLWMVNIRGAVYTKDSPEWASLDLPREGMAAHLVACRQGWTDLVEYAGDDSRLPEAVRTFNHDYGIASLVVAPLALSSANLGWIALAAGPGESPCEGPWRHALVDAIARQATLALHHSRVAEQGRVEVRQQAVLQERNRIARDIHDTLAQGFAAILMQLQAARRAGGDGLPAQVATALDTAVELSRTHMIEARRSVSALRPQTSAQEDVGAALQRITDLARRTSDIPVVLEVDALPAFGAGVEREIIGIAQEALTNAVKHSRAKQITVRAEGVRAVGFRLSVADDGRGLAADRCGAGFGMTSMHERAERIGASLTIVTAPRAGTEVVLAWEPPSFSIPRPADVQG